MRRAARLMLLTSAPGNSPSAARSRSLTRAVESKVYAPGCLTAPITETIMDGDSARSSAEATGPSRVGNEADTGGVATIGDDWAGASARKASARACGVVFGAGTGAVAVGGAEAVGSRLCPKKYREPAPASMATASARISVCSFGVNNRFGVTTRACSSSFQGTQAPQGVCCQRISRRAWSSCIRILFLTARRLRAKKERPRRSVALQNGVPLGARRVVRGGYPGMLWKGLFIVVGLCYTGFRPQDVVGCRRRRGSLARAWLEFVL